MVCRIIFTKARKARTNAGVSLLETLVGMAIGGLVIGAVCSFAVFNARSFAGFSSYATFDLANRMTADQMTKDFRMVFGLTNFSSNAIILADNDGTPLQYRYDSGAQTLSRIKGGATKVLLRNCNRLTFSMNMRNMTNGTFDFFPTTNTFECAAVTVNWCCARKVLGRVADDMPQTATIVIRN